MMPPLCAFLTQVATCGYFFLQTNAHVIALFARLGITKGAHMKRCSQLVVMIAVTSLLLSGCTWVIASNDKANWETEKVVDVNNAKTAIINNEVGDIELVGQNTTEVTVKAKFKGNNADAIMGYELNVVTSKDTVNVSVVKPKKCGFSDSCSADIKVFLPSYMLINITSGVGDVDIKNTTNALAISLGVGDIKLSGASMQGINDIKVGTGDIELENMTVQASKTAKTPTEMKARTGVGDITIKDLLGATWDTSNVTLGTGVGDVDICDKFKPMFSINKAIVSKTATIAPKEPKFTLSATTGTGDIDIK